MTAIAAPIVIAINLRDSGDIQMPVSHGRGKLDSYTGEEHWNSDTLPT